MKRFLASSLLSLIFLSACQAEESSKQHSELWGREGEKWSEHSRLPDFSHAGYQRGEKEIPSYELVANVKDFGAKGDGKTDDSAAFQKALDEAPQGAILVPEGRYVITEMIQLKRSGVVLRGVDPEKSVLYFPKSLTEVKPNWGATTSGKRTSNYSWSGGFLQLRGSLGKKFLTEIEGEAKQGDRVIHVADAAKLKPGQDIEIFLQDEPGNSLATHLYSGDPGDLAKVKGRVRSSLVTRITAIEGQEVHIDRPLRCDLRAAWKPRVNSFTPSVTESGIEQLGFEFPVTPYGGHFSELGYNPLVLSSVAHCWVKDIRIAHADSGPYVSGNFNTLSGLVFVSDRELDKQQCSGHHGVSLGGGDNLCTKFDFRTRFIHDFTLSYSSAGQVFSEGRGVDLALDHHKLCPHDNLFTAIDAGLGSRLWKCGGGAALGKHCGGRGTFWGISAEKPLSYPPANFGPPSINLVGLTTSAEAITEPGGKWFETIPPAELEPRNLHQAQLRKRLAK
ncbi:MAG: glycosyl hydrolase family 28-related protein [Verrucomicrobiales bacterium]